MLAKENASIDNIYSYQYQDLNRYEHATTELIMHAIKIAITIPFSARDALRCGMPRDLSELKHKQKDQNNQIDKTKGSR